MANSARLRLQLFVVEVQFWLPSCMCDGEPPGTTWYLHTFAGGSTLQKAYVHAWRPRRSRSV